MALPNVSKDELVAAMRRFDAEFRESPEWLGWESKSGQKYAVEHEGKLYPPKAIISLATGKERDSFYGGEQSNGYFSARGLTVRPLEKPQRKPLVGLHDSIVGILGGYADARKSGPFSKEHPIVAQFEAAQTALRSCPPLTSRPNVQVVYSAGKGNWASVPWIALMDERETDTTQRGRYVVFLFRADCSGVYLTLNQGVTEPIRESGRIAGLQRVRDRARAMRASVGSLAEQGFSLADDISLQQEGLGKDYEASTVAHKFYSSPSIPSDEQLERDLEAVLQAYEAVLVAPNIGRAWVFQGNPKTFDVSAAVRSLSEMSWTVTRHADDIHVGDRVYIWEAGANAGIVATAEVIEEVSVREDDPASRPFWRNPTELAEEGPRARLRIDQAVESRITRSRLLEDPRFGNWGFLRAPQGTNFPVSEEQRKWLDEMIAPGPALGPRELCQAFSGALLKAGLSFGSDHDLVARCFLSSVLAKPFVILTGLSGSGKTQLALKLGEWMGDGRYRVIPVRPDWTGPEALLGYEDALLPVVGGRRAWHVPDALQLILRSSRDPDHPHVLILDEMNLAHVERYFADVLSGIESREAVIPNLRLDVDGHWRVPKEQPEKIAVPRNLVVVGTVNVDETTYMFSPKVLDRANTIEFRVPTDALPSDPTAIVRPGRCLPAAKHEVASLLRIAVDDSWHTTQFAGLAAAAALVREVHAGLSLHGFEFGHRTYYEGLKLTALLFASGIEDTNDALDIFLLQKVLPRLHGSRRKLEPLLRSIAAFAFERRAMTESSVDFNLVDPGAQKPLMPRTYSKVIRMTRALHANQFASFAD